MFQFSSSFYQLGDDVVWATKTQLPSSGEFCKLRYDTIPVKRVSANASFYTNNSKKPNCQMSKMDNTQVCVFVCVCARVHLRVRE